MNLEERKEHFNHVYYENIGMCGCGRPTEVKNFIFDLLENHRKYKDEEITFEVMNDSRDKIIKNIDPDIIFEFIFHIFDNANLLEHGGSIYSSWFTDEGSSFLKLLAEFKNE